jgi:CDP-L-myo-inositol myo-inositolphosphotransferase
VVGKVDGPVSRLLNRKVSRRISGFIVSRDIPVTPNQMTLVTLCIALAAAGLILAGHLLWGGVLVEAASILDGVDGEIARARGQASRRGGFLDTMLDRYSDTVILAATAVAAYHLGAAPLPLLVASLAALSGDIMVSYLHARGQMDLGVHPASVGPLDSLGSRDVRLLLLSVLVAAGWPLAALLALAALAHTYALVKFLYLLNASASWEAKSVRASS